MFQGSFLGAGLVLGIVGTVLGEIKITNIKDGESVGNQLLILQGTVPVGTGEVQIANDGVVIPYPARDGKFKAAVMLKRGPNQVTLTAAADAPVSLKVFWNEPDAGRMKKFLRVVWILPRDHETADYALFQAPPGEDNSVESAKKRMAMAGLMYQATYAELMRKAGQGAKTFRLEREPDGRVKVHVHVSKKSFAELHAMKPPAILDYMRRQELNLLPGAIDATIAMSSSVTRYDGSPVMQGCYNDCPEIKAGEAWGAGGTYAAGWVHSGGMYSWAEDATQIPKRFTDTRNPRENKVYPDRPDRGNFWSAYATSGGSLLHEIGHGFGTNHTTGPCGVMSQGFHKFNRVFMAEEGGRGYPTEQICFEGTELDLLNKSPFLMVADPWTSSPVLPAVSRRAVSLEDRAGPLVLFTTPGGRRAVSVLGRLH